MAATSDRDEHPTIDLIWARPERPARDARPTLNREQIVRAALAVADTEGPKAITMRRIAAQLDAGTMSLYWYVRGKEDLLDLMLDAVFGEIEIPERPSGDWRADLQLLARETRRVLHRHSWLATIIGVSTMLGPSALRQAEFSLAAIDGLDLDMTAMMGVLRALDTYVIGFVVREMEVAETKRRSELSEDEWYAAVTPYLSQVLATGRYPTLARYIRADLTEPNADTYFEFGLDCLLDGIAARIAARR